MRPRGDPLSLLHSAREPQPATSVLERRQEVLAPPKTELYEVLRRLVEPSDHRFVLSLGGGSVPGLCGNAALVELLEELDLGRHVDTVWGTSAGAVVGGAWASGTPAARIIEAIESLDRRGAVDVAWPEVALAFLGRRPPDALIRGDAFHRTIEGALSVEGIEDCPVPFRAIACSDGGRIRRRVFQDGPLLAAISASMSLPGLLLARGPDGRPTTGWYDGGLVERTPLYSPISEHVRSGDPRSLVVLATCFTTEARRVEAARGFVERFLFTIGGLGDQLWEYHLREARERVPGKLLVLTPRIDDPRSLDFSRVLEDRLEAREYYKDRLQDGRLALAPGA